MAVPVSVPGPVRSRILGSLPRDSDIYVASDLTLDELKDEVEKLTGVFFQRGDEGRSCTTWIGWTVPPANLVLLENDRGLNPEYRYILGLSTTRGSEHHMDLLLGYVAALKARWRLLVDDEQDGELGSFGPE